MNSISVSTFETITGSSIATTNSLVIGVFIALLLLCGGWICISAYNGWSMGNVRDSTLMSVIIRFAILYSIATYFTLS
ncbi:integrating conjugative element protein [Mergibacter septicus]|uniref:Integrating conjugative element protein n=1 Tax=Mergibacter septicus TaxID=221402 RepID=A0A8E3MFL2_9PAST|nr:integrating conjugative element protein [Mergibacter septicus]QDJ13964.1 integrating conjugative element protein [Mergibacter septicus]UTU48586.1 TIGR03758 family integrating conjugative element protein [Mergibacter septicus]